MQTRNNVGGLIGDLLSRRPRTATGPTFRLMTNWKKTYHMHTPSLKPARNVLALDKEEKEILKETNDNSKLILIESLCSNSHKRIQIVCLKISRWDGSQAPGKNKPGSYLEEFSFILNLKRLPTIRSPRNTKPCTKTTIFE